MSDTLTVALVSGGAAIAGGLLSGAYQHARNHWTRPKLQVDYEGSDGNKVDSEIKKGEKVVSEIYIRVRVRNGGRSVAKGCRLFLTALHEVHVSGVTQTNWYDSMPLPWAGWDFTPRDVPSGPEFYVDVVKVSKDYSDWIFFKLFASQTNLKNYRGTYRFRLLATADNADPVVREIDVTYDGDWHNLRAVAVP